MIDLSSGITVMTLSIVAALVVAAALALERAFAIAPAIDGTVVASDRLEGRWSTYAVEVALAPSGIAPTGSLASHAVTLRVASGGSDWSILHGRPPGRRRSKEWHVKSSDPAVAGRLDALGAVTLVRRRYWRADRSFHAEIEPPLVRYDAGGRLTYRVAVGETRMTSLTIEQFYAQLDLLRQLAELERQANPTGKRSVTVGSEAGAHHQPVAVCLVRQAPVR